MSEYLEARSDALACLAYLDEIQDGYHELVAPGDAGRELPASSANAAELAEYVSTHAVGLREMLMEVQHDQRIAAVIQSEYLLQARLNNVLHFWEWLQADNMLDDEDPPHVEAQTCLPPEPGSEITGASVLAYVLALEAWLEEASFDLWGKSNRAILHPPKIGDRFLIGDFSQALQLAHTLSEGVVLRKHWIGIASLGNYWDTVGIGSSRARLLFKGRDILRAIIEPDHNSGLSVPFGGMFGDPFGSILGDP